MKCIFLPDLFRVRLVSIPGLRWTSSMCKVPSGETTRHEMNLPAFMRKGQRNKTRVSLIRLPGHGTPPGSGGSDLSRAIMLHDRPRRLLYEWGFIHDSSPGYRGSAVELKGELGVILTLLRCCTSYEKIYILKKGWCFQAYRIYSQSAASADSADWQLHVEIANFMQHGQIYIRVQAVIEVLITVVVGEGELCCSKELQKSSASVLWSATLDTKCSFIIEGNSCLNIRSCELLRIMLISALYYSCLRSRC